MTKRDLALDLFKTFKTGVTRKPNKPAPTKTVGQVGDPELIGAVSYTHLTLPTSDLV